MSPLSALPLLLACAVCNGAADADQTRAARLGVLVLLGVVVAVLAAFAWVLRRWARRARELQDGVPSGSL